MKKMFLTMALAFITMLSSAQFMVITTVTQPADSASWGMSNITDNMGIGYQFNDKMTVGIVKNGDEMNLWGRYDINFAWITMQAPTDSTMMDNMNIGIGYSLKVWNEMYIEPSYTMPMKADSEGNREGKMRLGLSYRF
jgi:opacity protein-like surface antigen